MNSRTILTIIIVVIMGISMVLIIAPTDASENQRGEFSITDDRGQEVFFDETPQTIVCLGKAYTEILFELDLGDRIVASDAYSLELDYEGMENIQNLGALSSSWDLETIAGLEPDVVIIHYYTWGSYTTLISGLEALGVKVTAFFPKSYDESAQLVIRFGELFEKESKAIELTNFMMDVKQEVLDKTSEMATHQKPRVYAELRNERTVNNGSLLNELILTAGGRNVAFDTNKASTYFADDEWVLLWSPDLIVVEDAHPKTDAQLKALYGDMEVHRFTATYLNYSPSLVYGLMEMAELLHPTLFNFEQV